MTEPHNPYATPQAPVRVVPTQGCWREGDVLVMQHGAVLPERCVKCNAPAVQPVKARWVFWHHPALYFLILLNLIIYALVAMIVRKKARVAAGLCGEHLRRRRVFLGVAWGGLLVGVASIFVAVITEEVWVVIGGFLILLVGVLVGLIGARIVYPTRITLEQVRLKGCGPAFLGALPSQ